MLFKDITIIDENFEVKEHMYVGVKEDRISYVSDKMPSEDFGEAYDGHNRLLIPGFYNSHGHNSMVLLRGYAENQPLFGWLFDSIMPFEKRMTHEDVYYGGLMGAAEMLRYGIVGIVDMYYGYEPQGKALIDGGVKGCYARGISSEGDTSYFDLPIYKQMLESIEKYDGYDNGRIRTIISLDGEYANTDRVMRESAEAAKELNLIMHVHVSETIGGVEDCRKRHEGRSPVKYLADCGVFDTPSIAAHCVYVDDEDIAILKEKNVTVATCPKSNAKLASGICPVTRLLENGVKVAIGTDSVASNNNLNMFEEMRFYNLLQKATTLDPTVITPAQTLYAATRAGALAQQREDCGLIKEGFKADLVVMDIDNVYMKPVHNLMNNLIYSASGNDVVMTMVDGKVLYKNGIYTQLDMEKITYEVEKRKNRILGELAQSK